MPLKSLLVALLVPLTWGLGVTFAKAGLEEFPPLLLMGMRFCLVALLIVWFVPLPRGYFWDIFWISVIGATIQYGLTFTGLSHIDASLAVIVVQLEVPFGILLAALFFGERMGWRRVLGLVLAFGGVAMIAGRPSAIDQLGPILLVISGAFIWAVAQILVKRLKGAVEGFALIAWIGVFAGPQMIVASFLIETGQIEALQNATWVGWSTVLYLAVVMTAIGYSIWFHVLARHPVNRVMPILLLLPVFSLIGSVLFLGERPGPIVLLGGLVVVVGVALVIIGPNSTKENGSA
ncbi:MAG: EamA family transporter [Pseudomonadota bacterium]